MNIYTVDTFPSGAMLMTSAKLFTHGGSQALRLPKEFRFEGTEVYIRRAGEDLIVSAKPAADVESMIAALHLFEPGTVIERDQPPMQERQDLWPAAIAPAHASARKAGTKAPAAMSALRLAAPERRAPAAGKVR
jgi:antitoxin VapB